MTMFGALAVVGAGVWLVGCNFTPDLSKTTAQTILQAEYDRRPAQGATIHVDGVGLRQGLAANYWKLIKVYPNQRWADYRLTDEGKKALQLPGGGDVLQWRPNPGQTDFHVYVVTVAANHLRVRDLQDPQNETLPGAATSKSAVFNESVSLDGVPQPLQDIAHNPGNKLSTRRQADFVLSGETWTLHGIS